MKSMKKIITIVMIAGLMIACFAISASAFPGAKVKLQADGAYVVQNETDQKAFLANHGISWDDTEKVWTLNNCTLGAEELDGGYTSAIQVETGKLILKGNNVIDPGSNNYYFGIFSEPSLTLYGDGILTIKHFKDGGIYSNTGNLTIGQNVVINLSSDKNSFKAIYAKENLYIQDYVKVDINSKDSALQATKIYFLGGVNVNCLTTDYRYCVAAGHIEFALSKGGIVKGETKSTDEDAIAFFASTPKTIVLKDNNKVVYPAGGKATLFEDDGDYAITEADGKTYATKAVVECTDYEIKEEGSVAVWKIGGKDGAVLTSTASYSTFESVTVDGKALTEGTDFKKAEGSTIITFLPAFLDKLSVGKHEVVIKSTYGSATGYLFVVDDKIVQTGDNNAIGAFAAVGILSAAAFVSLKKKEN